MPFIKPNIINLILKNKSFSTKLAVYKNENFVNIESIGLIQWFLSVSFFVLRIAESSDNNNYHHYVNWTFACIF